MPQSAPPCPVLKNRLEPISQNLPKSPTLEESSQLPTDGLNYAAALASLTRSMSAPTAASFCSIFS
jgi:hypothetical protein